MKTKEGLNPEYIADPSLETIEIGYEEPKGENEDGPLKKLEELEKRFLLFYNKEMIRLKTEREFLQSILDSKSYGGARRKHEWIKQVVVIEDVKKLLKFLAGK